MMKSTLLAKTVVLISASVIGLTACSTNTQSQNTTVGAIAGAVVGGVAGSFIGQGTGQIVAIGVGAIAGGLVGGYIGSNMDHADQYKMSKALDNNKPYKKTSWNNKKTGTQYTVKPTSKVMAYRGYNHCRTFTTTAVVHGKKDSVNGVACRQSDGSWTTLKS